VSAGDLNIFPTSTESTDLNFDASGGSVVTTSEMVAQKFVTFLLNQLGSVLHVPTFGTDFVYEARIGILRNEAELQLAFNEAVVAYQEYQSDELEEVDPESFELTEEEILELPDETDEFESIDPVPDDELFDTALLVSFENQEDRIVLNMKVKTRAGDVEDIRLPVVIVEL
jgi:hypothetical protein